MRSWPSILLALAASHVAAALYAPDAAVSSPQARDEVVNATSSGTDGGEKNKMEIGASKLPVVLYNANVNQTSWAVTATHVPDDAVFGAQCRHLSLLGYGKKGQTVLQAACLDGKPVGDNQKGTWWLTSLNLNRCLGNHGGRLMFKEDGNFDNSCRPCGLETSIKDKSVKLKCSCLPKAGGVPKFSEIEIGYYRDFLGIHATDGRLACGAFQGTKSGVFNDTSATVATFKTAH